MDELEKTLHYIIYHKINKILDNISNDFNINREDLNNYIEKEQDNEQIQENICTSENAIIVLPIISDDDTTELSNDVNKEKNKFCENNNNETEIVIKCKQITRKGKQCDYNAKPNSEYCGRHSK